MFSVETRVGIEEITHGQRIYSEIGHEFRYPERCKARRGDLCL